MKLISFCVIGLMMVFAVAVRGGESRVETSLVPETSCAAAVEADDLAQLGAVTCGGVICGKNMHCCNASCGRCAPIGVECPQIACVGGDADSDGDAL